MKLRRTAGAAVSERSSAPDAAVGGDGVVAHLGVLSRPWRAVALDDGSLVAPDGAALRWAVVAEDRVHEPGRSPTRRVRLVDGAPVVETSLRVPGGDVVVTAYAVADAGGALVLDVDNRAGTSVAFACDRADAVAARPWTAAPTGSPLPASWRTAPLAHGSALRIALAATAPIDGGSLGALPAPAAVARGWTTQLDGAPRLDLPDADVAERLVRARAFACLAPAPDAVDDPIGALCRAGSLAAVGFPEPVDADELGAAVERLAGSVRRAATVPWDAAAALAAGHRALVALGEERAAADLCRVVGRLPAPEAAPGDAPGDDRYEAWLVSRLAGTAGTTVRLLPAFPAGWLGANLSAYEVPTLLGPVGFAVRWHGERPALLWEAPDGVTATCPGLDPSWSSTAPRGEALLAAPR